MSKDKKFVIRCRAIILHEGKLLVVKHPHDTSFAALPGGHLEWGEDIRECLRREIIEELGIVPKIGRLLYVNNFIEEDNIQSIEFFFEVTNTYDFKNIKDSTKIQADEIVEVFWAKPTETILVLPQGLWEDFKTGTIFSDQVRYIHNK